MQPMPFGVGVDDPILTFVARWGLDSMAEDALRRLDPEKQHRVMSQFAPKDVARGASIPFMGFVKSVVSAGPMLQTPLPAPSGIESNSGLEAFVMQWGLDAKAQ